MQEKKQHEALSSEQSYSQDKAPLKIEDLTNEQSPSDISADSATKKESIQDAVAAGKIEGQEAPKSIRDIALDIAQPFRLPKPSSWRKDEGVTLDAKVYPSLSSLGKTEPENKEKKGQDQEPIQTARVIMPGGLIKEGNSYQENVSGEQAPLTLIQPQRGLEMKEGKKTTRPFPCAQAPARIKEAPAEKESFLSKVFGQSKDKGRVEKEPAPIQGEKKTRDGAPLQEEKNEILKPKTLSTDAKTEELDQGKLGRKEEAQVHETREAIAEWELEQALEAAGIDPGLSTCEELRLLEAQLRDGKSPFLQDKNVIIERKPALQLIQGLTALCDSQAGDGFEDELFDSLASSSHIDEADFKPMYRVKNRAKAILDDATRQAENIMNDARVVSNKLLRDTDAKIQEKYDQADIEIEYRLTSSKEESVKRLTEARQELTASRKQSVDILNLYMDKAEDDYQGYWERAEQTLFASLLRSDQVLAKAEEIYRKELLAIGEDLDVLRKVLEDLERMRP